MINVDIIELWRAKNINIDDFRKEDGMIDWTAYDKAEIEDGKKCYKCNAHIIFGGGGIKRLCLNCQGIDKKEELEHNSFIRCPKCKHLMDVDCIENYEILQNGEHEVTCDECNYDFEISTSIAYNFSSPELIKEELEGKSLVENK